jgi:hypothetical protein
VEWANTRLNGVPRAWMLFDALGKQWRDVVAHAHPEGLPLAAAQFLDRLDPRAELLIASGDASISLLEAKIRACMPESLAVQVLVAEGLEYYPLKNHAAQRATGDLLLFVDSDVVPDDGWLAHLIGSFGRPEIVVVAGQTYVAPTDLFSRAFALGWTYPPKDESGGLFQPGKFYANTIAFRTEVFRRTGFPSIGCRTRGAARLLAQELGRLGIPVWQNQQACVDHPPPSSFQHLAVRALAHGRDIYMTRSEERNLYGLVRSLGAASGRMGRGFYRLLRYGRRVGLRLWELPAALAICFSYHAFFALGGLLTHVSPQSMGRRFRV